MFVVVCGDIDEHYVCHICYSLSSDFHQCYYIVIKDEICGEQLLKKKSLTTLSVTFLITDSDWIEI